MVRRFDLLCFLLTVLTIDYNFFWKIPLTNLVSKRPSAQIEELSLRTTGVAIPPIFEQLRPKIEGIYFYPGDCHASDVGHWLAMTASFWLF